MRPPPATAGEHGVPGGHPGSGHEMRRQVAEHAKQHDLLQGIGGQHGPDRPVADLPVMRQEGQGLGWRLGILGHQTQQERQTLRAAAPTTPNGSRHPPAPSKQATSGTPTAAPTPLALTTQPIAVPALLGEPHRQSGRWRWGANAPPTPVSRRQARRTHQFTPAQSRADLQPSAAGPRAADAAARRHRRRDLPAGR